MRHLLRSQKHSSIQLGLEEFRGHFDLRRGYWDVPEGVHKLLSGKAPGVDVICPEYLKSLYVVGLSWLTCLCSIGEQLGTVPLDWQPELVVPLFKKGDRNYRCITLLILPGKVYSTVLEIRYQPIVEYQIRLVVEHWTSSIYPPQGV